MPEDASQAKTPVNLLKMCQSTCRRTLVLSAEALVVTAVLLALVLAVGVWRLKSGPVNLDFAKDYIVESLDTKGTSMRPSLGSVSLYWPDLKGPLLLGIDNLAMEDLEGNILLEVEQASMSFSRSKLLLGRFSPKQIFISEPSLRVVRTADDQILFNYNDGQAIVDDREDLEMAQETELTTRILEIVARPGTEADSNLPLADLQGFEMANAKVMIEDHKLGMTWFLPNMDVSFQSTDEGMKTDLRVLLPGGEQDTEIRLSGHYHWDNKKIDLKADLNAIHTNIFARKIPQLSFLTDFDMSFDAQVEAILGADFAPQKAQIRIVSEKGTFWVQEYSDEVRQFESAVIEADYDHITRKLNVSEATIELPDVTIKGSAQAMHDGEFEVFTGYVNVGIDEVAQEKLDDLWPVSLKEDNSYDWVVEKQSKGVLKDVRFSTDFEMSQDEQGDWAIQDRNLKAMFAFEGMSIDYRAPMIPVSNAFGKGLFDLDQEFLQIDVDTANIGGLEITRGDLTFTNIIQKGKGIADFDVDLTGPLADAFRYLEREPIGLDDEIAFDLNEVKGDIGFNLKMSFPTIADLKTEQIKLDIIAQATDTFIPDLVQGLPVSGGPFEIKVNNDYYTVSGVGQIANREADFTWKEFLQSEGKPFRNQVQVSMRVDQSLRDHFGIDLSTFLEGSANIDMTYTEFRDGRSDAGLKIDLTPTYMHLMPFGFDKQPGKTATAHLTAHLKNGQLKSIDDLFVKAEDLMIEHGKLSFVEGPEGTRPQKGRLKNFSVGQTTAQLEFEQEPNGRLKFQMDGPVFDLRPFMEQDENKNKQAAQEESPMVISINARRMRTSDETFVDHAKIFAAIDSKGRFNQLEMDAKAGMGAIYLRFKPDPQKPGDWTFRFEADDAGATLKAFDTYHNMVGGTLVVQGRSAPDNPRNMIGSAHVNDFRVVDAPILARILGSLSEPGLNNTLRGEGISFSRLEADYAWFYNQDGSLLRMEDGRTSGNSLGLTFEGEFDNAAMRMDISGTIVPLAGINKFLSSIPLIGDILSGGSDSVFAATYTMEGPAEEPRIVVNPLAALTPGILRRILFE